MAEPESGKQGLSLSFDSLADELEGKDSSPSVKNLAESLFDAVFASPAEVTPEAPIAFGQLIPQDVQVELGNGLRKIHHDNGDLTVSAGDKSVTQTTDQGALFKVGSDDNQVVFHLRLDGDIDIIGPGFDDTLHLSGGGTQKTWRNQSGTVFIALDQASGKCKITVAPVV